MARTASAERNERQDSAEYSHSHIVSFRNRLRQSRHHYRTLRHKTQRGLGFVPPLHCRSGRRRRSGRVEKASSGAVCAVRRRDARRHTIGLLRCGSEPSRAPGRASGKWFAAVLQELRPSWIAFDRIAATLNVEGIPTRTPGHRPLPPLFNRKAVHPIVAEILNSDLLGFLVSSSLRIVRNRGHNRLEAVLA